MVMNESAILVISGFMILVCSTNIGTLCHNQLHSMCLVDVRKILFALIRVLLVVIVSRETGESNLHHIYAAFVMDYNKEIEQSKMKPWEILYFTHEQPR